MSVAAVVFTCDPKVAAGIDMASGPCVPSPGKRRPLVSVHRQHYGDRLEHMTALYEILTGHPPSGAWQEVKTAGRSALAEFSDDFGRALARLRDAQQDVLVTLDEVAARWLDAVHWPGDQLARGLSSRLAVMVGWASGAIAKKDPLYCWFGPAGPST